jgi:DNA phosphorothioation-dependent restriction protein DptG
LLKDIVKAGVNFTNAYGRSAYANEKAYFVIDTEDVTDARKKIQEAGLPLLSDEIIYGISS